MASLQGSTINHFGEGSSCTADFQCTYTFYEHSAQGDTEFGSAYIRYLPGGFMNSKVHVQENEAKTIGFLRPTEGDT